MLEFCLLSVFFQCEDYNDRELKGDSTDEKTDDNAVDTGEVDTVCEWNNTTSSFVSGFPAISLGFTILGEIFKHVLLFFFNPTIELVTLCLRGWYMLGVFLLPVLTCLGRESQDLLSLCDGMHVGTD